MCATESSNDDISSTGCSVDQQSCMPQRVYRTDDILLTGNSVDHAKGSRKNDVLSLGKFVYQRPYIPDQVQVAAHVE